MASPDNIEIDKLLAKVREERILVLIGVLMNNLDAHADDKPAISDFVRGLEVLARAEKIARRYVKAMSSEREGLGLEL